MFVIFSYTVCINKLTYVLIHYVLNDHVTWLLNF